jgi:hypothetical protein
MFSDNDLNNDEPVQLDQPGQKEEEKERKEEKEEDKEMKKCNENVCDPELKILKYKNIGLSWNSTKKTTSLNNLEELLETERNGNDCDNWIKLNKTTKLKKLIAYADKYTSENNLNSEEHEKLVLFFRDCLDKKKLQRVKDVEYDKETGDVISIQSLIYNKNNHNFTLKNTYKKVLTVKSLSSHKKSKIHVNNDDVAS